MWAPQIRPSSRNQRQAPLWGGTSVVTAPYTVRHTKHAKWKKNNYLTEQLRHGGDESSSGLTLWNSSKVSKRFFQTRWSSGLVILFFISHCLSVVNFGIPPRCPQVVWRHWGGGRLSHFLPYWLRRGWQSVISQGKIPWNTPPWLGIEPGPRGGQTVSYPTELSWLTLNLLFLWIERSNVNIPWDWCKISSSRWSWSGTPTSSINTYQHG